MLWVCSRWWGKNLEKENSVLGASPRNITFVRLSQFLEGRIPDACDTLRDRDVGQAAVTEGTTLNTGNTLRDSDALQVGADIEGNFPDTGNTLRDSDACHVIAAIEGPITDAGNSIRNRDAFKAVTTKEGIAPDAGDRITFDSRRNN